MKNWVSAKIHNIEVTDKSVQYNGSIGVCRELMNSCGMEPFEKVQVINLRNGNRWETYLLPMDTMGFTLNGGGALLGEVGDRCVLITYQSGEFFEGATVLFCDTVEDWKNKVVQVYKYKPNGEVEKCR